MNRLLCLLAAIASTAVALPGVPALAQPASVELRALDSDPEPAATLQRGETFYVRVAYTSDRPLRIRVKGLRDGAPVPTTTNASPRSDPPAGEALVWIATDRAAVIDALEIKAEDEHNGEVVGRTTLPVRLQWTGVPAQEPRKVASWVTAMGRAQQQALSEQIKHYNESPTGIAGLLLGLLICLSLPGYVAAQIWALIWLKGGWRLATLVPLIVMCGALVVSLGALAHGSNLWPIWMILLAPLALTWIVVVALLARCSGASARA